MHNHSSALDTLSPDELTHRLSALAADDRSALVEFLRHLGEFDRRRLYLPLGFSNIHQYCCRQLKLSDGSANRRYTGARLMARFPVIETFLASGELTLKRICLLRKVLTAENHLDLLRRATTGTELDVEALAAGLAPKPDVRDSIRKLAHPVIQLPAPSLTLDATVHPEVQVPAGSAPACPAPRTSPASVPSGAVDLFLTPAPVAQQRLEVSATSAERFSVRMSVGRDFIELFDRLKGLLSHVVPDGSHEDLMLEALRTAVEVLEKRKRGADSSAKPSAPKTAAEPGRAGPSRYIPAAVRKSVWKRDGGKCAFVAADGTRCNGTFQVEFHHREAYARGGHATVTNLSLRCHSHNDFEAVLDFGAEHMDRVRPRRAQGPLSTVTSTGGSQAGKTGALGIPSTRASTEGAGPPPLGSG